MSATNRGAKRVDKDAYNTPSWCTELIMDELVVLPNSSVLEPCMGAGEIWNVLKWHFDEGMMDWCEVKAGKDFLDCTVVGRIDFIITNPPFSLAQEFIEKSLQMANCVVMLLPLGFYGAESRHEWWTQHEPTAQFILSKRPMFGRNKEGKWGTDSETYAWIVWDSTGRQKRGFYHLCPTPEQHKRSVAEFRRRFDARGNEAPEEALV